MKEKSIADWVQEWEKEEEYVGYAGEIFAVIKWNGMKYKIPFFVLEDQLNEMIQNSRPGTDSLGRFLNTWKHGGWNEQPIDLLKEALEGEMSRLEAYIMY